MTKHRDILVVLSRVILGTVPGSDDKTSTYPSCSFSSLPSVEIKAHRRHRHQETVLLATLDLILFMRQSCFVDAVIPSKPD